jgi:hypothetical protein
LAAALRAKAVVEVGTGVGVSGLRILESMDADGILTTIDAEPNHQIAAKETFVEAGIVGGRARLITGNPAAVLPRLADGAYDLVVINDAGGACDCFGSAARSSSTARWERPTLSRTSPAATAEPQRYAPWAHRSRKMRTSSPCCSPWATAF